MYLNKGKIVKKESDRNNTLKHTIKYGNIYFTPHWSVSNNSDCFMSVVVTQQRLIHNSDYSMAVNVHDIDGFIAGISDMSKDESALSDVEALHMYLIV